jgi:DNA-binding XRE family transcriptional regulator
MPYIAYALKCILSISNIRQNIKRRNIGQRMARLRQEHGITQVELAEMLGVPQPMISAYENGRAWRAWTVHRAWTPIFSSLFFAQF